jgi:signal transduction histidine kinase
MLSHELRNPLAPIRNAAELLARSLPKDSGAQGAIGVIQRQVVYLTRLVDDLLDVSRISQGRIELKLQTLELATVIAQAVETVAPLLRERRHNLQITSHHQPLHVRGDPARLVQCVANILANSAKYTDAGGQIQVQARAEAAQAVISIADNGSESPMS